MSEAVAGFPPDVLRLGTETYLGSGALLWREGDAGGDVALVLKGTLEVFRETSDGEVVLDAVEPGIAVGEVALDGGTRTASLRARTECHVLRVGATEFRQLIHDRPDVLEKLYWAQVNRFRTVARTVPQPPPRRVIDPLTRAYSYTFFIERLEAELQRARQASDSLTVALCDVDDFRGYHEWSGAEVGDRTLPTVASLLRGAAGRGDLVARYSGAHFAALFYGADQAAARTLAESFRAAVEQHEFPGPELQPGRKLTLSVGLCTFPVDAADAESLLRVADLNLYRARDEGGNRIA